MSLTYAINKPTPTSYGRLKKTLKNSTAGYGSALSASYFITHGAEQGVSAMLGAVASYTYVTLLSNRVDKFETSTIQKEFIAPWVRLLLKCRGIMLHSHLTLIMVLHL